jgi:thiol-disulfide isomerase/thioredoxin
MKYKNLNYLVFFIYLISSSGSYSIERPDIKNLIIHNEKKKIEKAEFFNSKNKKVSLNDYKSNIVIINFWATWCAPCKEEMPHLSQLKLKPKFKDIEIIPINIADEKLKKSKEFFKELNINNLEIFYGSSLGLAKVFKLRGIPTTIIVDKEGYELARIIGFIDFENKSFLDWLSNHL